MNELKLDDVMRALECCITQGTACRTCPLLYDKRGARCYSYLKQDALALLREKDAEIERLSSRVSMLHEIELSYALQYGDAIDKDIARKQLRAEAITEFAERLKERMREVYPADIYDSDIDQIANELKEEPYEQM